MYTTPESIFLCQSCYTDAEFDDRLGRILRGPMWSGQAKEDIGGPLKARVNLVAVSKSTLNRNTAKSDFSDTPTIQVPAIQMMKEINPNGRYWIKLDETYLKESIRHSMKDVWNGDTDLNDGELQRIRQEYKTRFNLINSISTMNGEGFLSGLEQLKIDLNHDCQFLEVKFQSACNDLRTKMNVKTTCAETLKGLNWEVVEFNQLLQDCREYQTKLTNSVHFEVTLPTMKTDLLLHLKNVSKKKRRAATHVLVIAVSDEIRNRKPYTIPIQFIPYKSLRDQHVRDMTEPVKKAMSEAGLKVVGTVTDGEFNSLRTRGETGPLHIWQLIHDTREAVRKMSKKTFISMLTCIGEDENGNPVAEHPYEAFPNDVLFELFNCKKRDCPLKTVLQTYEESWFQRDMYQIHTVRIHQSHI